MTVMWPTYDENGEITGEEPMVITCNRCLVERVVEREYVSSHRTNPAAVYVLSCGHHVI